ncbi:MAG: maleylpyruvate isomerase family mycothiol-dependent enzyme [Pseudonocardiaceae bacterium]|nr:maleylpyruvate isomerase family mycothiol-dependent enzyme [Pseudonocardiaceae bacterium]
MNVGSRLLLTESDALLRLLRATPEKDFDRPTVCTGWSVRDVLGHCGAALTRLATNEMHDFSAENNQRDVVERRDWSLEGVLRELEDGYRLAVGPLEAAAGKLDVLVLGEWVHGGDVREALGAPHAYASAGVDDALTTLADSKHATRTPLVRVALPDRSLVLGSPREGREAATLRTDVATLIRLYAGRPAHPERYALAGAQPAELAIFR